eukprot:TRINITY_DN92519_c0_g1_i1.p1 TRINITY_DN92519_c0_g1~~TRINITY_DN92519_c0_g1_i1.p1  ORF type:complete len:389 (+),score=63.22 TRINITY_DN92519_c0_g1_i1:109-1275(+)
MRSDFEDASGEEEDDHDRGLGGFPRCLLYSLIALVVLLATSNLCLVMALMALYRDEDGQFNPNHAGNSAPVAESSENQIGSPLVELWRVYGAHFATAKYIDLTHAIEPTMPVWEAFGPPVVKAGQAGIAIPDFVSPGEEFSYAKHGFITTSYMLPTDQLGTQLDPPAHWNEYGATISDLPATLALRPLVVIDVHQKVQQNPKYFATRQDCTDWEAQFGSIPEGAVVFFRTDWSRRWGQPGSGDFPSVSLDALKFLHLERNILFHGHEPLDTDSTASLEGEAWLMHNNYAQAEGVANLHLVQQAGCLVTIGFAKMLHGSGGYARYVAICPESHVEGETIAQSPGAPLKQQAAPLRRDFRGVLQPMPNATPTAYCQASTALGCVNGSLVS